MHSHGVQHCKAVVDHFKQEISIHALPRSATKTKGLTFVRKSISIHALPRSATGKGHIEKDDLVNFNSCTHAECNGTVFQGFGGLKIFQFMHSRRVQQDCNNELKREITNFNSCTHAECNRNI